MKRTPTSSDRPKNPWPNLFTSAQYAKLLSNGIKAHQRKGVFDPKPVVKLFTPD
jgi:Protein of unknown function (DUF2958)